MLEGSFNNIRRFRKPFFAGLSGSASMPVSAADSVMKGALKEKLSGMQAKLEAKETEILELKKELEKKAALAVQYKDKVRKVFIKKESSVDVRERESLDATGMMKVLKEREKKLADEYLVSKKNFDAREKDFQRLLAEKDRRIAELENRIVKEKDLWRERYHTELAKAMRDGAKAGEMLKKSIIFNTEADMGSWSRDVNDVKSEMQRLKKMMNEIRKTEGGK